MSLKLSFWSLLVVVTNGDNFMQEQCINDNTPAKLMYLNHCNSSSMIHVIEESIDRATSSCTRLTGSCTTGRADTKTGLTVNCNGQHTCTETVDSPVDRCNSTNRSVRVRYQCIRDSLDMCSPVELERTGSVYLHSPGFPDSVGVSAVCSCSIIGSQMRVGLLELYGRDVLIIYADDKKVWPAPGQLQTHLQYNTRIGSSAKSVTLLYATVVGDAKQNAWVKITGDGVIHMKCSGSITSPPSSPPYASPTSPTESTEASTTENSSTVTVAAVCGVIIFLLVVVIVLGYVYFKIWKPSKNSHNDNMDNVDDIAHYEVPPRVYEEVQETSRDRNNTYNVLDTDDKTAHDYGKLHVYGNTGYKPDSSQDDNIDKQSDNYINVENLETNCV